MWLENYAGTREKAPSPIEGQCFLYLMLTVGLSTALGVASLMVSVFCLCKRHGTRTRNADKNCAQTPRPQCSTDLDLAPRLESLVEACYPELQVLDALSRSVRQKKQQLIGDGGSGVDRKQVANFYSQAPSRPTVKQMKQRLDQERNKNGATVAVVDPARNEALYWEIGQHAVLSPTRV